MNIRSVNIINPCRNLNFGISGFDKTAADNKTINKKAEDLKNTVNIAVKRWSVDLPIYGSVSNAAGHSMNLMLNYNGNGLFAHVNKANQVERIITVEDDGQKTVTSTYVFDKETEKLKDYREEIN